MTQILVLRKGREINKKGVTDGIAALEKAVQFD
jgi:hypothetical protein